MAWCAISKTDVGEPYYVDDGTVTGDIYERMLWYYLLLKPANYPSNMISQQNGASPPNLISVRQYSIHKLPNIAIGEVGHFCGLHRLLT